VLAETCVKELYLGLHALIREHAEAARVARLNGNWIAIDPTSWGTRNAMTIEVGLGAAGRDQDLAAMTQLAQVMTMIVGQQGGAAGPIVTLNNAYNAAIDLAKALGRRQPERYFTNPAGIPVQPPGADGAAANPLAAMAQAQAAQSAAAVNAQAQVAARGQDIEAGVALRKAQADAALKKYAIDQKAKTELMAAAIRAGA